MATDPTGQFTNPHWTVFGTATYQADRLTVAIEERFHGAGRVDNTKVVGAAALNGVNINRVPATWYTNLYASYDLGRSSDSGIEIFARVNNLFNKGQGSVSPNAPLVRKR